jgi:hypothetical protein
VFPEVALALCRASGFESAFVFHPGGSGNVEADRFYEPCYALVAERASGREVGPAGAAAPVAEGLPR